MIDPFHSAHLVTAEFTIVPALEGEILGKKGASFSHCPIGLLISGIPS